MAVCGLLAAVGVGEAAAKPDVPCKKPNHKCGKGNNAICCTSSQVCANGACTTLPPPDPCAGVTCPSSGECYSPGICSEGSCSDETFKGPGVGCSAGRTCDGAGTCTCYGVERGRGVDCQFQLGDNQCTTTQCINGLCYNDTSERNHEPCTNPLGGGSVGICCGGACRVGPCQ